MVSYKRATFTCLLTLLLIGTFLLNLASLSADGEEILVYTGNYSVVSDTQIIVEVENKGFVVTAYINVTYKYQCETGPEERISTVLFTGNEQGTIWVVVPIIPPEIPELCWEGPTVVNVTITIDSAEPIETGPNTPPVAQIDSAEPKEGTVPLEVLFTGTGEDNGIIVAWEWNFGDGTIITGEGMPSSVTHTYMESGPFLVFFKIWDCDGAVGYAFTKILCLDIKSDFIGEIAVSGDRYNDVQLIFDASDILPENEPIESFKWDFGDGTQSEGQITEHSYETAGNYTITLFLKYHDTTTRTLEITIAINENLPPVAIFSISAPTRTGVDLLFDATQSYDKNNDELTFEWDFGDGTVGEGVLITHSFSPAKEYMVTLQVNDNYSTSSCSKSVDITDNTKPVATFEYDGDLNKDCIITFDANSSHDEDGDELTFSWDFGDGSLGEGENITHTYAQEGEYDVKLSVSDGIDVSYSYALLEINKKGRNIWPFIILILTFVVAVFIYNKRTGKKNVFDDIDIVRKGY
ncbi:MAG: PKD domain-containing protein [Candidatus Methanofastidiosia archaeon]